MGRPGGTDNVPAVAITATAALTALTRLDTAVSAWARLRVPARPATHPVRVAP